jgi:hypothetical protein
VGRGEAAGGVAEDDRAVDGARGRGGPAACEAVVEELVGGRAMVPHGDRGDAAESGGVEDEVREVRAAEDHVVREFVLHDDVEKLPGGAAAEAEAQDVLERVESGRELCERDDVRRQADRCHP